MQIETSELFMKNCIRWGETTLKFLEKCSFIFNLRLDVGRCTKKHCASKQKFQEVYVQPRYCCFLGNFSPTFFSISKLQKVKKAFKKISCRQTCSTVDLSLFCEFDVLWVVSLHLVVGTGVIALSFNKRYICILKIFSVV